MSQKTGSLAWWTLPGRKRSWEIGECFPLNSKPRSFRFEVKVNITYETVVYWWGNAFQNVNDANPEVLKERKKEFCKYRQTWQENQNLDKIGCRTLLLKSQHLNETLIKWFYKWIRKETCGSGCLLSNPISKANIMIYLQQRFAALKVLISSN